MIMKHKLGCLLLSNALILTACNNEGNSDEDDASNKDETINEEHNETPDEDDQVSAILEQSIDAMSEIDSFAVSMTTEQDVAFEDETFQTEANTDTNVTHEPFAYHEATTIVEAADGEEMNIETYFTDAGFYSYESSLDEWTKLPEDIEGDIRELFIQYQNPDRLLDTLMTQVDEDDIVIENNQDHYAITASGDEEGLLEVGSALTNNLDGGMDMVIEDMRSVIDINDITYELVIDKETYYFREFNAQIDMNLDAAEEDVASQQTITTTYDAFNEIEEITVPDHIQDTAEEIDFQELDDENE